MTFQWLYFQQVLHHLPVVFLGKSTLNGQWCYRTTLKTKCRCSNASTFSTDSYELLKHIYLPLIFAYHPFVTTASPFSTSMKGSQAPCQLFLQKDERKKSQQK